MSDQVRIGIDFSMRLREGLKEKIIGNIYVHYESDTDIIIIRVTRKDTDRIWETARANIMNYICSGEPSSMMVNDIVQSYKKYILEEHLK